MRSLRVELGARSYSAHIGAGLLACVGELARDAGLTGGRAALVTDANVAPLYASRAMQSLRSAGFEAPLIEVPPGEASKSSAMLERVYDQLIDAGLDRQGVVFALGGGVVGDLAGFAAATFLRGVPLVQVPTSVVAQVDSALGGKTGIDHRSGKNLIGAFYQPSLIVADVSTLATLPEREFREGLAEVIKYGAILDAPMIDEIERVLPALLSRDAGKLEEIVARSLAHKAAVVQSDEREGDRRKILNFGHTVGHALEAASGYAKFLHGEAVAIGIVAAARLSCTHAGLDTASVQRLERLLSKSGLPTKMPSEWRSEGFLRALKLDKKRIDQSIEFVLIEEFGRALTRRLSFEQVIAQLEAG